MSSLPFSAFICIFLFAEIPEWAAIPNRNVNLVRTGNIARRDGFVKISARLMNRNASFEITTNP
jgi:hypothetical protein